ncbi:MAG: tRNA guanosine(34) transglycosylase Tgt [Chloroflexi bacterium]|nr:tRNA guanosine(34) transglycosylase Tgt [Chloroflexota bacterium]
MSVTFDLVGTDGAARVGVLHTPHGDVPTPAFLPVATQGSVKTVAPQELREAGVPMVLGNTYHLFLRPGVERVRSLGGLSAFMGWNGPVMTDSGGFQAYSLGSRVRVREEGLQFQSPVDGSVHLLTPEGSIAYQEALGSDVAMVLDQCLAYTQDQEVIRSAMERTHRWAQRSRAAHSDARQALFGIVQGGVFPDLRETSAALVTSLGFAGYAIGGLSVGEPKAMTYATVAATASLLPQEQPRHLLGVGSPEDLVECVARGVDLFDCALPTRVARHGALFTSQGRVNVTSAAFKTRQGPVEEGCDCFACRHFSAAYLNHLLRASELLGLRLATIHNLRFVARTMEQMREAILKGAFSAFAEDFLRRYRPAHEEERVEQRRKRLAIRARVT